MDAAEWAQRKVEDIQAAQEVERVRAALNLERQNIRRANFPDLVQAVNDSFRSYCEEYNKRKPARERRVDYQPMSGALSLLKRDAGISEMQIQVNHAAQALRVTAHNCDFRYNRTYRPEAIEDGSAMLSCADSRRLVNPDDVARDAMDEFLAGRERAERL